MSNPYSALTSADFLQAALNLLPRGRAWPREQGTTLVSYWEAVADLLALLHADATNLLDVETDPEASSDLLADWERAFGLPDSCTPAGQSIAQRHQALLGKITDAGGLSRQRYIDLAAGIGVNITITEFEPWTVDTVVTAPLYDLAWRFAWQVNAPAIPIIEFTCDTDCEEPLELFETGELECLLSSRNRASRVLLFQYG